MKFFICLSSFLILSGCASDPRPEAPRPTYLLASRFDVRTTTLPSTATAFFVSNDRTSDSIKMFEDPAFLVTGFSSKEERQKPIEISSGFSSIKPLDLPDQVSYRLFRMSGINSYESRHIEVLPGKYEILVYCNSGSAWMTFPKTVVAEANKKYHVICFKPIGEKDLANVVIVEKSLPDEISINEYISKVKR